MSRKKRVYLHRGQRVAYLIGAKEEYGVCPRAWGKTQGPFALRTIAGANAMPRGATGLVGKTYMQLIDRTLPPLLKAWENFGYIEGIHYWFRRFPGKFIQKVPTAIYPALQAEHCITWANGHVFHFISQDRPGLANGKNLDAVAADEVRFLNHKRYMDDIAATNRGNAEHFGHLAMHHMITMYTDMPTSAEGSWIFEKADQVDHEKLNQIMHFQVALNNYKKQLEAPNISKNQQSYLYRKITEYSYLLNELRKGTVYYHEGDWRDNLPILGIDQIKQWRREMTWPVFQASILNRRLIHLENGFYALFDADHHQYNSIDYGYIDGLGIHVPKGALDNCRKDSDVSNSVPLHIALDHNASINSLVIGQPGRDPNATTGRVIKVIKSMYVKAPMRVQDLIDNFCNYYKYKQGKCEDIFYYYDHTSLHTDSTRTETIADIVYYELSKRGWNVIRKYIGQQPLHDTRYRMWQSVFTEKDQRFIPIRFNQENSKSVVVSMQRTGVVQSGEYFKKDKNPEKNKAFPQEEAPHQSDALDTLYIGMRAEIGGIDQQSGDIIIVSN